MKLSLEIFYETQEDWIGCDRMDSPRSSELLGDEAKRPLDGHYSMPSLMIRECEGVIAKGYRY